MHSVTLLLDHPFSLILLKNNKSYKLLPVYKSYKYTYCKKNSSMVLFQIETFSSMLKAHKNTKTHMSLLVNIYT